MSREEQIRKAAYSGKNNLHAQPHPVPGVAEMVNEYFALCFKEGAEWADSHPHWIPVEEMLPKFDEQVLVYGLCPNGCRLFYVDCLIQDINDNGYPKWDDDTIIPTHWMPIVPPRKED